MEDQKQHRKLRQPEEKYLHSDSANLSSKKEIVELADAANEMCAAIEIFLINRPDFAGDFVAKILLQRKRTLWNALGKLRMGL